MQVFNAKPNRTSRRTAARWLPTTCVVGLALFGFSRLHAQNAKSDAKPPAAKSTAAGKSAKEKAKTSKQKSSTEAAAPKQEEKQLPFEDRPYRIRLAVAFDPHPELTAAYRRQVLARVRQAAERVVGQMWQTEVVDTRRVFPCDQTGLERLQPDKLVKDFDEARSDKVIFVTVRRAGPRLLVFAREWDTRLHDLGPIDSAETAQRRKLPETIVRLAAGRFRPILMVHQADMLAGTAELVAQGGHYPPVDPQSFGLKPGHIVVAYFRYFDRDNVLQEIRELPLTYLLVDGVKHDRVSTTIVSGLRVPLGARKRRVEELCMAVAPDADGTLVTLAPQRDPDKRLAAHNVTLLAKTQRNDDAKETKTYLTDRRGKFHVPADPAQPVVWLEVHSGSLVLARVPFVPGLKREQLIQVPDDSLRLKVEGDIALLTTKLVETIAIRSAYMARAKALARKAEDARGAEQEQAAEQFYKQMDEQFAAIDELPGVGEFQRRLTEIRVPALDEAKGNRSAVSMIGKQCEIAEKMISQYLDNEPVRRLREELEEIRKL